MGCLTSRRQLENTREKLRMLQEEYEATQVETGGDDHVRQLTLRSLKRLINQLTEEVVRFEAHMRTPTRR